MYSESLDGDEGEYYCEVVNGLVVRQIHAYGSKLYWATQDDEKDPVYDFTDQPEFNPKEIECEEISTVEFQKLWDKATEV